MRRVAILTPSPGDEAFGGRWRDVFECDSEPLVRAGFSVEGRAWSDVGDLAGFDLVMPLLAWGYHREQILWLDRLGAWEQAGVRLLNPPSVLRWNSDKSYLGRLAGRGAPVVSTLYVDRVDEAALAASAKTFGSARIVAKPLASSTAYRTIRWPDDPASAGPLGTAMIQPYLASIETDGEVSLVYLGGRFSHAIRKVPRPGDFRVQPEFAGIIASHDPSADELEAAEAILGAVEEELLYARIDLVRGSGGRPELIELELIEPDLYLGYDPGRGEAWAEAVRRAID